MSPPYLGIGLHTGYGIAAAVYAIQSLFNPITLAPALWYDFSAVETLFVDAGTTPVSADGALIYQVNDKSGNGRHAIQPTIGKRPAYKTAIQNGLAVSRYDGLASFLDLQDVFHANPAWLNTGTLFVAHIAKDSGGLGLCFCVVENAGISTRIYLGNINTNQIIRAGGAVDGGDLVPWPLTINTGILSGLRMASGTAYSYVNAAPMKKASFTNATHATTYGDGIGAYNEAAPGSYFEGDILEILFFPQSLTKSERKQVEGYLNNKWSLYQNTSWEVPGSFTSTGIAYDTALGTLWVVDYDANKVNQINKTTGALISSFNLLGTGASQGIAYDTSDHTLWVCRGTTIHQYNKSGNELDTISTAYTLTSGLGYRSSDDSLLVGNYNTNVLHVIRLTDKVETGTITVAGVTDAEGIDGVAVDAVDGTLWVTQNGVAGIVHSSAIGATLASYTNPAPAGASEGICYDTSDNTLWYSANDEFHASIPEGNRVYHLSKTGGLLPV